MLAGTTVIAWLACASCATPSTTDEPGSVSPRYTPVEPAPDESKDPPASAVEAHAPPKPAEPDTHKPAEPAAAPEDAPLLALLERYYADFGSRNWDGFSRHFWPGATIATIRKPPGAAHETVVVTLVDEYVTDARGLSSNSVPITVTLSARDVRVDGMIAQVLARFEASTQSQSERHAWHGVDAFTLVLHDGEWRIAALAVGGGQ